MSEIGDERLRELRNEIDNYGTGSLHEANTLVAAIDELLAARPLLEAVNGAREALDVATDALENERRENRNLASHYDQSTSSFRKYDARARQAATGHDDLRRIRELVDKT